MPGLVNAHTHSGQHLDRGMAPNLPLDLWLMWVVYGGIPFSPDDSYTLAMSGALEMLRTGCTAVLDHAWVPADGFDDHVEAMASAYADAGIRCGLAPMIQDRDIFESMAFGDDDAPPPLGDPVDPMLLVEAMERYLTDYAGRARFTPMVGPSAPQRCSDDLMVGLVRAGAHPRCATAHPRARDPLAGGGDPRAVRPVGGGVPRRHRCAHRSDEPGARRVDGRRRLRPRAGRRGDGRPQSDLEPALRIRPAAARRPARPGRERGARR